MVVEVEKNVRNREFRFIDERKYHQALYANNKIIFIQIMSAEFVRSNPIFNPFKSPYITCILKLLQTLLVVHIATFYCMIYL